MFFFSFYLTLISEVLVHVGILDGEVAGSIGVFYPVFQRIVVKVFRAEIDHGFDVISYSLLRVGDGRTSPARAHVVRVVAASVDFVAKPGRPPRRLEGN